MNFLKKKDGLLLYKEKETKGRKLKDIIAEAKIEREKEFQKYYLEIKEKILKEISSESIIEFVKKNPNNTKMRLYTYIEGGYEKRKRICKKYNKETNGMKLKYNDFHSTIYLKLDKEYIIY